MSAEADWVSESYQPPSRDAAPAGDPWVAEDTPQQDPNARPLVPGREAPAPAAPIEDRMWFEGIPGYSVLKAFERGANEASTEGKMGRLGLSEQNLKHLRDAGVLYDPEAGGPPTILKAFGEGVLRPLAAAADLALVRLPHALGHGIGEAALELGVPRDFVALGGYALTSPGRITGGASPRMLEKSIMEAPRAEVPPVAEPTVSLPAARDLGVIGPDVASIREGTPREAAAAVVNRAQAAGRAPDEKLIRDGPTVDKAGNIRLDLLEIPDAAKNVIRDAAEESGGFMPARAGDIPLAQQEALGQALGMPVKDMDVRGMGRLMRNDQEVRVAIQAMIQSAEEVSAMMQKASQTGAEADLIEFQRLRMRHSSLQEQVAGLTAEWGRTGNVFQEFGTVVKNAKELGDFLSNKKGQTIDDLRNMVKAGAALDPRTQLPKFLMDARKPGFMDKFIYVWTNGLVSGPFSQAGYIAADTMLAAYETALVTPVAGAIGKARDVLSRDQAERVYMGEAAARLWGFVHGAPDAIVAAYMAVRHNLPVPLPREAATGVNPVTRLPAIEGTLGDIAGLPQRALGGIHALFNHLGYRSEIEAQAYRAAAKDGLNPLTPAFYQRKHDHSNAPSDKMMDAAIANAHRITYTDPLSGTPAMIQQLLNKSVVGKLIVPFFHIPYNTFKIAQEGTPLAWLNAEMRANLKGDNGHVAQDTAYARMTVGSAVMAWVVNLAANDIVTGDGPLDPKQRAEWLLTHKPNSVQIGGYWYSYERFPPLGTLFSLGASFAGIANAVSRQEAGEAAGRLVQAATVGFVNATGMQGLSNLIQMMKDPDRYGDRYLNNFAASMIPYSSLLGQTAGFMDPQMREAKTFIDALKNKIPVVRESLYPVRDWTGVPRENPRGGGGAFVGSEKVNTNPVDLELQRLNIWPTKVDKDIRGVRLTPAQYDRYQSTAGPLTRMALESLVKQDGWYALPDFVREATIKSTIKSTRAMAAAAMQLQSVGGEDDLVRQGIDNTVSRITGTNPRNPVTGKRRVPETFARPELPQQ